MMYGNYGVALPEPAPLAAPDTLGSRMGGFLEGASLVLAASSIGSLTFRVYDKIATVTDAKLSGPTFIGLLGATTFVVNPLIVKHFRPKDSYLKRLIIGIIADKAAGFIVGKVTK